MGHTVKEEPIMQTTVINPVSRVIEPEQRRYYRIERQFSSQRRLRELVRDLLRAHSGE